MANIFSNIFNKKEVKTVEVKNESIPVELSKPSVLNSYEYREPELFNITLKNWRYGVEQALSENNPDRIELADVYNAMLTYDSQIIASINQRKLLTVQGVIALYNEDGSINEEATKLIKTPNGSTVEWMRNFLNYTMDSIFYGFELISINNKNGEIKVNKIPEKNVIPHLYSVIKDTRYGNTPSNLFRYDEGSIDFVTCKVSYTNNLRDLGLLSACAPSFFSKCTSEWASHTRKYGMPVRVLKLENTQDVNKMKGGHQALKNMQTGSFITMNKNDEFEFHGDNSKGSEMYEKLNIECNNNISKIILGQTGTLDEKAYVGSAAVHESILGSIIRNDREFLESVVNSQLIPKLQIMGLLPNNIYFGISQDQKEDETVKLNNIKTIKDLGFKVTKEFIEKNFNIELEDDKVDENQEIKKENETIKEDGENSNTNI
jgi:hypothetical protein